MNTSLTKPVTQLTRVDLDWLINQSRTSARNRTPCPLHPDGYAGPQALINAVQPGSYMRPHMHPEHDEIWVPVRGKFLLGTFGKEGRPEQRVDLSTEEIAYYLVPRGQYHSAFALEKDSVFLNFSQGPFNPSTSKVFPSWAPAEDDAEKAPIYFAQMQKDFLAL